MVNGKGPTLTLIRNKADGRIAGGFTSISWMSRDDFAADSKAYLFSVDNKEKYASKPNTN
jgi:hypothetical protein